MLGLGAKTRGGLEAAKIYEVNEDGSEKSGGKSIDFMFNPNQYSVALTHGYGKEDSANADSRLILNSEGHQTLTLNQIVFDAYEELLPTSKTIVEEMGTLWELMKPIPADENGGGKKTPRYVAFEWGPFTFVSIIKTITQNFTLFDKDGTPVRAEVNITFEQFADLDDYPSTNPTSGGGPPQRVWMVKAGDRIDTIAADVYGDATKWRLIAGYNGITNPLTLRPGQELSIPVNE